MLSQIHHHSHATFTENMIFATAIARQTYRHKEQFRSEQEKFIDISVLICRKKKSVFSYILHSAMLGVVTGSSVCWLSMPELKVIIIIIIIIIIIQVIFQSVDSSLIVILLKYFMIKGSYLFF